MTCHDSRCAKQQMCMGNCIEQYKELVLDNCYVRVVNDFNLHETEKQLDKEEIYMLSTELARTRIMMWFAWGGWVVTALILVYLT
jgi:hypothetical protein